MQTESNTTQGPTFARSSLGQTYITPGAEEALMVAGQTGIEFLRRHVSGDFGELTDEDIRENELSLRDGFRVLSTYRTSRGDKLWIITEADRVRRLSSRLRNTDPYKATRRECFPHSRLDCLLLEILHVRDFRRYKTQDTIFMTVMERYDGLRVERHVFKDVPDARLSALVVNQNLSGAPRYNKSLDASGRSVFLRMLL